MGIRIDEPCELVLPGEELSLQYKLTWLINADAHEVAHLCDEAGVGGTEAFARELGIPVTEWFDW